MRIFSKFHDYYDTALGFGIDPNIIYERKEEDITDWVKDQPGLQKRLSKIHDNIFDFRVERINSPELQIINKIVMLFCGKIYFCIKISYKGKHIPYYDNTITKFIYTFDAFKRVIAIHSKINLEHNITSGLFDGTRSKPMTISKRFKLLFDKQGIESEVIKDIHFELDTPVIVIDYDLIYTYSKKIMVYKNRCLKDMEFFKIMGPFTTFQEISMFIGGVMGGKSPIMIEVSDKDRISKHGFDKFSFRKEPKE
jgi:hypothetical protein